MRATAELWEGERGRGSNREGVRARANTRRVTVTRDSHAQPLSAQGRGGGARKRGSNARARLPGGWPQTTETRTPRQRHLSSVNYFTTRTELRSTLQRFKVSTKSHVYTRRRAPARCRTMALDLHYFSIALLPLRTSAPAHRALAEGLQTCSSTWAKLTPLSLCFRRFPSRMESPFSSASVMPPSTLRAPPPPLPSCH